VALSSGVLLLAGMAWKLAREMGLADIRKNYWYSAVSTLYCTI